MNDITEPHSLLTAVPEAVNMVNGALVDRKGAKVREYVRCPLCNTVAEDWPRIVPVELKPAARGCRCLSCGNFAVEDYALNGGKDWNERNGEKTLFPNISATVRRVHERRRRHFDRPGPVPPFPAPVLVGSLRQIVDPPPAAYVGVEQVIQDTFDLDDEGRRERCLDNLQTMTEYTGQWLPLQDRDYPLSFARNADMFAFLLDELRQDGLAEFSPDGGSQFDRLDQVFLPCRVQLTRTGLCHTTAQKVHPMAQNDPRPPSMRRDGPVRVFLSYAHRDEGAKERLHVHLAALRRLNLISDWNDREIMPGTKWAEDIDNHIDTADLVLMLISADFINSDYCYSREYVRAKARHDANECALVPIVVGDCDWQPTPLGELQALPKNGSPIALWSEPEQGFADAARRLRGLVEGMAKPPPPS